MSETTNINFYFDHWHYSFKQIRSHLQRVEEIEKQNKLQTSNISMGDLKSREVYEEILKLSKLSSNAQVGEGIQRYAQAIEHVFNYIALENQKSTDESE